MNREPALAAFSLLTRPGPTGAGAHESPAPGSLRRRLRDFPLVSVSESKDRNPRRIAAGDHGPDLPGSLRRAPLGGDSKGRRVRGIRGGKSMRRIWIVLLLLWPATALAQADLSVDLRTDYVPQFDFDFVRVSLVSLSDPSEIVAPVDTPVFEDDPAVAGVRAADFTGLGGGDYLATVSLRDDAGHLVAERDVSLRFFADFSVTTVLSRPDSVHLTQRDDLIFDADADGEAGPGDVVRYDIRVFGPSEPGLFRDVLRTGSALIPGSVRTSPQGHVLFGNGPGHAEVRVDMDALAGGEVASIAYEVHVTPVVTNQGLFSLLESNPSVSLLSARIPTDDPDTPAPGDPTVVPALPGTFSCAVEAYELEADRDALLDDPDADGVPAIADDCPATAAGSPVDDRGCSRAEFCGAIDATGSSGPALCGHSDWMNDEPRDDNPKDCKARDGLCLPL